MNKFITYRIEDKHFVLAFFDFAAPADRLVVILQLTLAWDSCHRAQMKQRLEPFTGVLAYW